MDEFELGKRTRDNFGPFPYTLPCYLTKCLAVVAGSVRVGGLPIAFLKSYRVYLGMSSAHEVATRFIRLLSVIFAN